MFANIPHGLGEGRPQFGLAGGFALYGRTASLLFWAMIRILASGFFLILPGKEQVSRWR